ncbi:MAG: hypothetical protein ACHQ49_01720 [Elusimicrobiota bacterium]
MRKRSFQRIVRGKGGQTVVEYLLTTLTLVTVFAGMYGFLQGQLKVIFKAAGMVILTPYCGSGPCG